MVDSMTAKHNTVDADGLVRTTVRLPAELHTAVKVAAAAERGNTFQSIVAEALRRFLYGGKSRRSA